MTTSQEATDSQGIGGRVRNSLALARTRVEERVEEIEQRTRAQWVNIPTQLRDAVDGLMVRVRKTLDLPSRGEIADLIARIEDMDAKLAELEAARAKTATKPEPEPEAKPKAKATAKPAAKKKAVPKTGKKTNGKASAPKKTAADRKAKIAQAAKKTNAKARKAKPKAKA